MRKSGGQRKSSALDTGKRQGESDSLGMFRRRKWLVLAIMVTILTAAGGVVFSLPEIYRASASILVERQQLPESFVQSTVTTAVSSRLQTITRQLLSSERLQQLIQRFDLYADWKSKMPLPRIVARMRRDIRLEQQRSQRRRSKVTTAFTLSYSGSDPQKVAQVTNALAAFYIEENVKVREQQATGTSQFLEDQLSTIREKLEGLEQSLGQYKEQYIGELPEQLNANLAALERLNTRLRLNNDKLARVNERRTSLARQLAGVQESKPSPPRVVQAEPRNAELEELQRQLKVLRTRFSDKYPTVIRLKAEIATLEEQLALSPPKPQAVPTAPVASVSPERRLLQSEIEVADTELKVLRTEEQSLLRSLGDYQKRVENTPKREQELQTLSRDYETTQTLYHSLLKRQEEAKLSANMEQNLQGEQFRLIAAAGPPSRPAAPDRLRLMLVAALLALGFAAVVAFVAERLDTSFHSADDLRAYVGVPVLQSLPRIEIKSEKRWRRWRFALAVVVMMCSLSAVAGLTHNLAKDNTQLVRLLAL